MKECERCFILKRLFCVWACPSVEDTIKRMEVEYEKSVGIAELGSLKPVQFVGGLGSSQTTYN